MFETLIAKNGSHQELIRSLYKAQKERNPKFSLSYLCQRAGIPSKGYLGDVMLNKRRLNLKYALKLGKALGLVDAQLSLFVLTVKRDHTVAPEQVEKIKREIRSVEKLLKVQYKKLQVKGDLRLMSKVFCMFNILEQPLTIEILQTAFPKATKHSLTDVLSELELYGAIELRENGYHQIASQVLFPAATHVSELIRYLTASLAEASIAATNWFERQDESYFESTVLSVRKSEYLARLPEIKEFFARMQSDIESEKADALVYFNIQVYPDDLHS